MSFIENLKIWKCPIGIEKCLIYDPNNYEKSIYDLAIQQNYHVIPCTKSEFYNLKQKHIKTIKDFISDYYYENFPTEISVDSLDWQKSKNFCYLSELLAMINKLNDSFKIHVKIIDNLPVSPLYAKNHETILLNSNQLQNLPNLLSLIFSKIFDIENK